MADRKICFFDIDGTIWDIRNVIPESTVRAIRAMREKGNLAFLCSGRCRGYIQNPALLDIGFDGIVSGCGTMIEYNGEVVFYKRIEPDFMEFTINTVRKYGFRPILEGRDYLYMDEEEFADEFYGRKLMAECGDRLKSIADNWGSWEVSKFSCATDNSDRETCFRILEPYYDFMIHNAAVAEIVPKGFHKGTGIEMICDLLGSSIEDTFAFGDSVNDLGMIRTAGTGVVMGNGQDAVKAEADYVTTSLMEDGIYNACLYYGLI